MMDKSYQFKGEVMLIYEAKQMNNNRSVCLAFVRVVWPSALLTRTPSSKFYILGIYERQRNALRRDSISFFRIQP